MRIVPYVYMQYGGSKRLQSVRQSMMDGQFARRPSVGVEKNHGRMHFILYNPPQQKAAVHVCVCVSNIPDTLQARFRSATCSA